MPVANINSDRANFKTSPFAQYLRQSQILILEILNVFLRLKFASFLILNKIEHFETASDKINFPGRYSEFRKSLGYFGIYVKMVVIK